MRLSLSAAAIVLAIAFAAPASAQGRGGGNGGNTGNGGSAGGNRRPTAPAHSALPSSNIAVPATTGAVPFAWIDDASMIAPGSVALSISAFRWQGTNTSEVNLPVVGVSVGAASRLQLGASIPRVMNNTDAGIAGGLGTTYVSAKIGLLTGDMVKLAVAPTLEILGEGALQAFTPGERRTQFGVPVSIEGDSGPVRVFASAGGFSPGIWFGGGGLGVQASSRIAVSGSVSRAWTSASETRLVASHRQEVSGTVAYAPASQVTLFGSLGRTIGTTDDNGAGTTVSAGVVFVMAPRTSTPWNPAIEELTDPLACALLFDRHMKNATDSNQIVQKDPDEWKTGDEPMTAAQRSYLETLAQDVGEKVDENLTKAEASKLIEELRDRSPRLRNQ